MGFTACVIGGGPAGIAAALNLRRAGAMVTCMELNSTVGGMWASAHGPTAGTHGGNLRGSGYDALGARGLLSPIYPSMQCVLPKDSMAYSDMRFSFLVPQYPHYAAVHEYLQEYAMRKGVHGLVRYNTWVESVAWLGEGKAAVDPEGVNVAANKAAAPSRLDTTSNATGKDNVWLVRTVNVVNGDVTEWKFDCVVVATGRHHRPRLPDPFNYQYKPSALSGVETGAKAPPPSAPAVMAPIPGQTRFMQAGGHVLHASEVKRFRDFTGKTVVVYGNGVSAFEYAKELQRAGALVVHATELERDLEGLDREGARGRVERTTSDGDAQAADAEEELPLQQRTIANIRAALERYSPLNNPRFVTKLLSRRNSRLRLSLRASMHGPTGYGDMNRSTNMWDRSFNKPKSQEGEEGEAAEAATAAAAKANAAKRVAPPLSESLEALRGAYTEIPVLGDIGRCGPRDILSTDPNAKPNSEEEPVEQDPVEDRDVVISIVNHHNVAAAPAASKAAAAAADAVLDASNRTSVTRLSSIHSPKKLLSLIRNAEYNPYEPRSVALLSRFRLLREGDASAATGRSEVTSLCVRNVDAIICCTGYYQSFSFLKDATIRADVEFASRRPQLRLAGRGGDTDPDTAPATPCEADEPERRRVLYNGLYMGTLLRRNPTISFVGLQAEVVPPFLLFEAQTAYIAAAITARVPLPKSEEEMDARERKLGVPHRRLASVRGLGVGGSAEYYKALLEEAGLASTHYGYYETMWTARRHWFAGTWAVQAINRVWQLTPQKRKHQHVVISNEI